MPIRFHCQHCNKPLRVPDHLGGKKAQCPACKHAITIPETVAPPADLEAFAASAFGDKPEAKPEDDAPKTIDFPCPYCSEDLHLPLDLGGKQSPCPECRRIIRVPMPKEKQKGDWRELVKKGPSAALINQPEIPDDVMTSAQKTRVSTSALLEADAIEVEVEPVGVKGWLKRGFYAVLILGVGFLIVSALIRGRTARTEKNYLELGLKGLENPKVPLLLKAEGQRIAGEVHLRNKKAGEAKKFFYKGRSLAIDTPPKDESPPSPFEQDMFLCELALSVVDLGGTFEEDRDGEQRIDWKKEIVQTELRRTLEAMKTDDGKAAALRDVGAKLLYLDKGEVAIGLATNLAKAGAGVKGLQRSPLVAQLVGLLAGRKNEKAANELLKDPGAAAAINDSLARIAYCEGLAHQKRYAEALKLVQAKGPARLDAAISCAAIALADQNAKAAEAKPFLAEALDILKTELKGKAAPWQVLQVIRLAGQTDLAGRAKEEALKDLTATFKARAQLELFRGHLTQTAVAVAATLPDAVGEKQSVSRALAWLHFARHNASVGDSASVQILIDSRNELEQPLMHLGLALGEQDRRR
ncbi:MAG: zinc-ribbon domain-containing protein [Gemmataceae bacterium]|nr:zinc-ribbon domain-containing protein [Gemmataceae bacterium]MCI0738580.1 zinc-ribbon domain-containing protein [Gemmataceae bacterium]